MNLISIPTPAFILPVQQHQDESLPFAIPMLPLWYDEGTEKFEEAPYTIFKFVEGDAPLLENRLPNAYDTGVSKTASVVLDVVDVSTGINPAATIISIDGVVAWQNDTAQNGYTGGRVSIVNGYTYTLTPGTHFDAYEWIEVAVLAEDNGAPTQLNTSYQFRTKDLTAPYLRSIIPGNEAEGWNIYDPITITVADEDSGVDPGTVKITINGVIAWQNDSPQTGSGYTGSRISRPGGYLYTINRSPYWHIDTDVTVEVEASDKADTPNAMQSSYSFTTEFVDFESPTLSHRIPGPLVTNVHQDQTITFSLTDNRIVNLVDIKVWVRGELVFNGAGNGFQQHWTESTYVTNDRNGYDFEIVPDVLKSWRHKEQIIVRVVADD